MKITVLTIGSVLLLSACGGSNDATDQVDTFVNRAEAIQNELEDFGPTTEEELGQLAISTGSVQYTGVSLYGDITVDEVNETITPYAAIGTLTASLDFGASASISATATDFVEINIPAELGDLGDFETLDSFNPEDFDAGDFSAAGEIDGTITFELNLGDGDNEIGAPFDGDMFGRITKLNGDTVIIDDNGFGLLVGPNAEGIVVGGGQGDEDGGLLVLGIGTQ